MKLRKLALAASITAIMLTGACKKADGGADAAAMVESDPRYLSQASPR